LKEIQIGKFPSREEAEKVKDFLLFKELRMKSAYWLIVKKDGKFALTIWR